MITISNLFWIALVSFAVAMSWTPLLTNFLYHYKVAQQIRDKSWDGTDVPVYKKFHADKAGTPSMGGLIVWVTTAVITFVVSLFVGERVPQAQIWLLLFVLVSTGILGAVDDVLNMKGKGKIKGLGISAKFFWQIVIAGLGAWWFYYKLDFHDIQIPLLGILEIGWWYIPLFMLVLIGTANAVNITDGLDGLAGGLLAIAFAAFGAIAFMQGNFGVTIFCVALIGSLIAFLWFNINPARFFMGDTGAFAMGATLAVIALLTNSVVAFVVIGLLFVIEAASSLLQRFSKKYFKRKIFIAAPFHLHLQAIGWSEPKIVMRAWLLGGVLAVLGIIARLAGFSVLFK